MQRCLLLVRNLENYGCRKVERDRVTVRTAGNGADSGQELVKVSCSDAVSAPARTAHCTPGEVVRHWRTSRPFKLKTGIEL